MYIGFKDFTEFELVEKLTETDDELIRFQILANIDAGGKKLPIIGFILGTDDARLPTFGLFAGAHGLEKIGTHLACHFLRSIFEELKWDKDLRKLFQKFRLVSIPLINPGGMLLCSRANPAGVDLMRNTPVTAEAALRRVWPLCGQELSPKLLWYRGDPTKRMERETESLLEFVRKEVFPSKFGLTLDLHSGFGCTDRIWYPYGKSTSAFPMIREAKALATLVDKTYPGIYKISPQADNYLTHGDPWDFLTDEFVEKFGKEEPCFLPLTLELGSWIWALKNPRQLLLPLGLFNPFQRMRYEGILKQQGSLLNFLLRATVNYKNWCPSKHRPTIKAKTKNWLFLRGLTREKRHWLSFPERFEKAMPGTKVFCLDVLGCGEHHHKKSPSRVPEMVADLRERWLKLKEQNEGDWTVVSISLGGMIALHWASEYPNDFCGMVVMNSSIAGLAPFYKRMRPRNYLLGLIAALTRNADKREAIILKMTSNKNDFSEAHKKFATIAKQAPVSPANFLRQLVAAMRFKPPKYVGVPLLVISSRGDRLVNSECSNRIALRYQAKHEIHESSGHDLPLDAPDWTIDKIREWVSDGDRV